MTGNNGREVRDDLKKQEVIHRVIDAAILVFFEGRDVIACSVLASAAKEASEQYCGAVGIEHFSSQVEKHLKPNAVPTIRKFWKEPYNFFKHADRDHDAVLRYFDETLIDWNLLFAIEAYGAAFKAGSTSMTIFRIWVSACDPEIIAPEEYKAALSDFFKDVPKLSRSNQKKFGLDLLQRTLREPDKLAKHLADVRLA